MSDILLAKPVLPPDWIDVSVGEPHIVREILLKVFDMSVWELPKVDHMFEYPSPIGYKPLVKLLEDKHQAPVIITNGAKQGLGACFYVLNKLGKTNMAMKLPYWALIPPLAAMHGVNCMTHELNTIPDEGEVTGFNSYLCLSPNNPDGHVCSNEEMKRAEGILKSQGIPFIHDAAYYTRSYMPSPHGLPAFGDVQVYSISKMLGLSGLRVGYVVCPNPEYYKLIQQYMETMTVGVSIVSQMVAEHILHRMHGYPTLTESFENQCMMGLEASKKIIKQVDPEILEVPANISEQAGMFGWFKTGPKANFTQSKINVIDGSPFGIPGMVRMNLAFPIDKMEEIVKRLNSAK